MEIHWRRGHVTLTIWETALLPRVKISISFVKIARAQELTYPIWAIVRRVSALKFLKKFGPGSLFWRNHHPSNSIALSAAWPPGTGQGNAAKQRKSPQRVQRYIGYPSSHSGPCNKQCTWLSANLNRLKITIWRTFHSANGKNCLVRNDMASVPHALRLPRTKKLHPGSSNWKKETTCASQWSSHSWTGACLCRLNGATSQRI